MAEHHSPTSTSYQYARLMRQAQSPDPNTRRHAQERLVKASKRTFRDFGYNKSPDDADEAIQSARVAFARNISKFNPDSGAQYPTYAKRMMMREVAANYRTNHGLPDPQDIKRWEAAQDAAGDTLEIPTWSSVGMSNDFGEASALADQIPDRSALEAFAVADTQMDVQRFITSRPWLEQEVYRLLYVEQKTQTRAAQELGVSQPRVHQLHDRILSQGKMQLAHLVAAA